MQVLFIVVPLAMVMAALALGAFFVAVRRGQFDDLDTPQYRAIFDDAAELSEPPKMRPHVPPSR